MFLFRLKSKSVGAHIWGNIQPFCSTTPRDRSWRRTGSHEQAGINMFQFFVGSNWRHLFNQNLLPRQIFKTSITLWCEEGLSELPHPAQVCLSFDLTKKLHVKIRLSYLMCCYPWFIFKREKNAIS